MPKHNFKTAGEVVDEFGELEKRLAEVLPLVRRYKALAEKIRELAADQPRDRGVSLKGEQYQVVLSACGPVRRVVDLPGLHRRLGDQVFYGICSLTVGALEAVLPGPDRVAFVKEELGGGRKLEVVPRRARRKRAA